MVKISKFKITIILILIFLFVFDTIKDTQTRESEYKYSIYRDNIYIGKCKDIETTKKMTLIKVIYFVGVDGTHTKTIYVSENYIF